MSGKYIWMGPMSDLFFFKTLYYKDPPIFSFYMLVNSIFAKNYLTFRATGIYLIQRMFLKYWTLFV